MASQAQSWASNDWEAEEGIPRFEDPFIQKYLQGREALIEEEKKKRHDVHFRNALSPVVREACRIVEYIRAKELRDVWTKDVQSELGDEILYPGMMFRLARDRMEKTDLWKIMAKMPKGALLHGHIEAMIDLDILLHQVLSLPGMYMASSAPLDSENNLEITPLHFKYSSTVLSSHGSPTLWEREYHPLTFLPVQEVADAFPGQGIAGFREWLKSRCTIGHEASLNHHHGIDAIWEIFGRTFQVVDSILYYEPIFRACLRHMLAELHQDGIRYVEFRLAFDFEYRRDQSNTVEEDYIGFFEAFDDEIKKFKTSDAGKGFYGARMIWTTMRRYSNRDIVESMKQCILTKEEFPDLIAGFDLVGREDDGRPLVDLLPVLFWFKKQCALENMEIPFLFHAGECLGDGNETDRNLYDAILLGSRRIGHGFSLFKHPLLIELVKDKRILIECCPISNEILRLTSSIMAHPLPALLARGVPVALCNDDPTLMGYGKNGLTHDFCQVLYGLENTGLSGVATMAENSIRWSCFEDQSQTEWLRDIKEGITGHGLKAVRLKDWNVEFESFCQWVVVEFGPEVPDVDEA
ncbi:Adenosine/AMP deaminase family protein [Coccidioides posadasii C735 delta SOWgp]|uniref:adenosine deaminase n=1 Tax=Coccidioides posadasii (strain C735) TaxID=222929 RepID=C5PFZ3_COCP7|nr:Adenosine/AMP deaminase family protein [Coccidioides posadasii C735 delta SOWgp]EER23446.1 Adenosine/AMP deaminase family protein [Coccidioides posadasii C735 delta SOWgp]|eukprot:XP_003065591.1 Adenosine/AMP deaminase family protein [Coccidioides posadasii C735 delta SOWgp]